MLPSSPTSGPARLPARSLLTAFAVGGSVALFALQALAARRLELTFDEAYYALWSRSLAFGYLDHPPMVALLIRVSTALFGGSEAGVRALSLLLVGALLPTLIAVIAWRMFQSAETTALAVLMWIGMPLVMAGAVFATPDAPLVLFWTLGLMTLAELWRTGKARWLVAMGLALGLMLQSKFTAAFFAAGVAFAFISAPSLRRWLVSPASAAALAIAAAIFAPFVVVERRARLGDLRQAARPRPAARLRAVLCGRVRRGADRADEPAGVRPFAAAAAAVPWRRSVAPGSADEARRLLGQHDRSRCGSIFCCMPCTTASRATGLRRFFPPAPFWPPTGSRRPPRGRAGRRALARAALWAAPLGLVS